MTIERTLYIIKHDAVSKNVVGKIISRFEDADPHVVAAKIMQLSRQQAEKFYAIKAASKSKGSKQLSAKAASKNVTQ